ncbi:hypothetical protein BLOT_000966 [Blomia tropicalis]|nr:hypothetical protein BLOT_000966 [Blomia tropicalis]
MHREVAWDHTTPVGIKKKLNKKFSSACLNTGVDQLGEPPRKLAILPTFLNPTTSMYTLNCGPFGKMIWSNAGASLVRDKRFTIIQLTFYPMFQLIAHRWHSPMNMN